MNETLVRIEDIDVPGSLLRCPKCHRIYKHIDTALDPWVATCPKGHEWAIQLGQLT